jgi:hypothetical protein
MVYDLKVYVIEWTDGTPILHATVTINDENKLTDLNGYVKFTNIPDGLLNVYVNKTGYKQFWFQTTTDEINKIYSVQAPLERESCYNITCNLIIE